MVKMCRCLKEYFPILKRIHCFMVFTVYVAIGLPFILLLLLLAIAIYIRHTTCIDYVTDM